MKIYRGSPAFRLFWSDVGPIFKDAASKALALSFAAFVAALSEPAVGEAVKNHFGSVAALGFAALVGYVGTVRFLADNTKAK